MSEVKDIQFAACTGRGECWKQCGCTCYPDSEHDSEGEENESDDREHKEPLPCKGECAHAKCFFQGTETTGYLCQPLQCSHQCPVDVCYVCGEISPQWILDRCDGKCQSCATDTYDADRADEKSSDRYLSDIDSVGDLVDILMETPKFVDFIRSAVHQSMSVCEFCGESVGDVILANHKHAHYVDARTSIMDPDGYQCPAPDYTKWSPIGQRLMLSRYLFPVRGMVWGSPTAEKIYHHASFGYHYHLADVENGKFKPETLSGPISGMDQACPPVERFSSAAKVMDDYARLCQSIVSLA